MFESMLDVVFQEFSTLVSSPVVESVVGASILATDALRLDSHATPETVTTTSHTNGVRTRGAGEPTGNERLASERPSYASLDVHCKALEEALAVLREDLEFAKSESNAAPKEDLVSRAGHVGELRMLKDGHEEELRSVKEGYEEELMKSKDERLEELKVLEDRHRTESKIQKDEHQAEVKKLQEQLNVLKDVHHAESESWKDEHQAKLKELQDESRKELNDLRLETDTKYEALKAQHSTELSQVKTDFQAEASQSQEKYDELKKECDKINVMGQKRFDERNKLRIEVKMLKEEKETFTKVTEIFYEKLETLIEEIVSLKWSRDILKPLLDVGAAVRLRFLEKAKEKLTSAGDLNEESDPQRIERGNNAAHGGNGAADLALSHGGYLEGITSLDTTLKQLYWGPYERWRILPAILQSCMDFRSTVITVETANCGGDTSALQLEHLDIQNRLVASYTAASPKSDFAENEENKRMIERLEDLTVEIVRIRRNGNAAATITSSSTLDDGWTAVGRGGRSGRGRRGGRGRG